jgi:hypothetical protein
VFVDKLTDKRDNDYEGNNMKSRLSSHQRSLLLIVFLVLGFGVLTSAVTKALTPEDRRSGTQSKDYSITVTGCLREGDGDHLFQITGTKGDMYLVKSSKVILKDHAGHKVALTGTIKVDDDEDLNVEYREADVRLLIVSSLKIISAKCQE